MKCSDTGSGIYKIMCTTTGRFYVGSAVNFRNRCTVHKRALRQGTHKNAPLQAAWNKYGEDAFSFCIVEYVDRVFLLDAEQSYLDKEQPFGKVGFNILKVAGNLFGYRHSTEAKEKMRAKALQRKHPNRARAVAQYDTDGTLLKVWPTIKEAADFYKAKSDNSITQVLDHPRWKFRGYVWRKFSDV